MDSNLRIIVGLLKEPKGHTFNKHAQGAFMALSKPFLR